MRKNYPVVLAVVGACWAASGCTSDSYSDAVKYTVRVDPLVLDKNLGDERIDPDRPGIFPILFSKDIDEPLNPMYPKRATLFKEQKLRDPMRLSNADRRDLEEILQDLFGTPARPHVRVGSDVLEALKLQEETLEHGSSLYRVNCLHCHGVTGDGRGPTGRWINPHPRDYRQGRFKFMSVDQTGGPKPPRRDDLLRVLHRGVEGTAMPSFVLLPTPDLEDLVSYVIHLSMRGRVEYDTIVSGFDYDPEKNNGRGALTLKDPSENEPLESLMVKLLEANSREWVESQRPGNAIQVAAYPYGDNDRAKINDSIQRGFHLFKGEANDKLGVSKEEAKAANCVSCHTSFGRRALYKWDEWGTLTRPRDLTQGVFRGGRRPVDVYYRIHSGISGSGMTSFGKVIPKSESLWDLVNFVQTLPYPAMRKDAKIQLD